MATEQKQILVIGLKESQSEDPEFTAEKIRAMVTEQMQQLGKLGFQVTPYFAEPDNPSIVEEVKELVKSRKWDGVGCGFGLRGTKEFTPLFERIVTTLATEANPTPRFLFPTSPNDIYNSVTRTFP